MARAQIPRSARFALAVPGGYRLPRSEGWHEVRVVNLSDTGILFRADKPLSLDTMFEMVVETSFQIGNLAPGRFRCLARISRTEPVLSTGRGYPVAAEFVEFRIDSGH